MPKNRGTMEKQLVQIEGMVENVVFGNENTGFAVIELNTGEEILPVVGELYGVEEGEELKVTGTYASHPKFGYQFKAEVYERSLPATATAIKKFLCSGAVKGIGSVLAQRIVDVFGEETLNILEENPQCLAEVKGITQKKADALAIEFHRLFGMRSAMMFFSAYGMTPSQGVRIWKKWGVISVDVIKDNPYLLCEDDIMVEFRTADQMALSLGLDEQSGKRIFGAIQHVLRHNLKNGHTCLARETVSALVSKLLVNVGTDPIEIEIDNRIQDEELFSVQRNKEFLFLPSMYGAERYIALRLSMMLQNHFFVHKDMELMIDKVETEKGIRYEGLQRQAIREALQQSILLLTGGPGTGKTTTLNAIIDLLEQEGLTIAIAAPTGRAAKRISEVTGRDAKTIHRLLEVDFSGGDTLKFIHNEKNPLRADAIVIDEMSMVDTILFESLLRGVKMGAKLILVGDSDQLPSVGAGNILRDLIDSEVIPTVQLKQVFRQAAESLIVTNAHKIVGGEMPDLAQKDNDFFFMQRGSEAAVTQTVVELVAKRLPKSYGFSPIADIQVLTPQRQGNLGVYVLNSQLQEVINPKSGAKKEFKGIFCTFREGDKVMQIRNNYDMEWTKDEEEGLGIFNGDIGIIKLIDNASSTIVIDFEERICNYPFEMASELELAYAVTVHKSQGSEYDAVILPIFGGFDKLYFRNLLYTAVTRAKKLLIIVGSKGRVEYMVQNNRKMLRYTNLRNFLTEAVQHGN